MYSNNRRSFGFGGGAIPSAVKNLLIANCVVFVFQYITRGNFDGFFALWPKYAFNRFYLWQFFTYMFMHGGLFHLGFNMYILWMFGSDVERMWGSKAFLKYYFITGIGAGLMHAIVSPYPTVGASGAIMGVLVAFAMLFPDRKIMLIFPPVVLPAKILVMIYAGIDLFLGMTNTQDRIAHFAHIGGALVGYLYIKQDWKLDSLKERFYKWKRQQNMHSTNHKSEELEKLRRSVDQILDKANEVGIENLSREEKIFLKRASKIINRKG